MAGKTRGLRGAPRWTRDDILRDAAETFSLMPRPSTAARCAFVALLREFWPHISEGTRLWVEDTLRGSARVGREVLETLDALVEGTGVEADDTTEATRRIVIARAAGVSHREGLRVTASVAGRARPALPVVERPAMRSGERIVVDAPPLAAEWDAADTAPDIVAGPMPEASGGAADHARAVVAHLATDGTTAAPALQPRAIEAALAAASHPAPALARLLDITVQRAENVVATPRARGTAIALRALGVAPGEAEALVTRWRGGAPNGFAAHYAALSLEECLETVAAWRRQDGALGSAANARHVAGDAARRRSA